MTAEEIRKLNAPFLKVWIDLNIVTDFFVKHCHPDFLDVKTYFSEKSNRVDDRSWSITAHNDKWPHGVKIMCDESRFKEREGFYRLATCEWKNGHFQILKCKKFFTKAELFQAIQKHANEFLSEV